MTILISYKIKKEEPSKTSKRRLFKGLKMAIESFRK
jgi:hypothetical protein